MFPEIDRERGRVGEIVFDTFLVENFGLDEARLASRSRHLHA